MFCAAAFLPSQFQGVLRKKSFKGNSILPMKQRFKFVRMECASAHSNQKRPSRDSLTGQAINHFLFSHGERRGFFRPRNTLKTRKRGERETGIGEWFYRTRASSRFVSLGFVLNHVFIRSPNMCPERSAMRP